MSVIWEKAPNEVVHLINRIAQKHHDDIAKSRLSIGALFATSTDDDNPHPLKINKYPQAATVKAVSTRDRVAGKADVEIAFDKGQSDELSARQREALIDHELTHIVLLKDKKRDNYKLDLAHRPKVRMRLHDWQIGGFRSIAERYGDDAIEVMAARDVAQQHGQLLFDFALAGAGG